MSAVSQVAVEPAVPPTRNSILLADVECVFRTGAEYARRVAWLRPLLLWGPNDPLIARREELLEAGKRVGLSGEQLVDWAMEGDARR
jgi:hypothetical protein